MKNQAQSVVATVVPGPFLTLNDPCTYESCIEVKIKLNVYFHILCGASKSFRKAFGILDLDIWMKSVKIWAGFIFIACQSRRLSKYIETKVLPACFYFIYKAFLKN